MKLPGILTLLGAALVAWLLFSEHLAIEKLKFYKEENAKALNIKHGLLSLDEWKSKSFSAISERINGYEFTKSDQKSLRPQITTLLYDLIDRAEKIANKKKEETGFAGEIINFAVTNFVINFEDIRKEVPDFTDRILKEIGKKGNQKQVKVVLIRKLKEILDLNAPRADQVVRDYFFTTYSCSSYEECGKVIQARIDPIKHTISGYKPLLLAITAIVFLLHLVGGTAAANRFNILALSIFASTLLAGGLYYPMISIDARITDFSFSILGVSVDFEEQVLFYQSKSILEIVQLLLSDGKIDTVMVGGLILLFSIIFPITKIGLSLFVSQDSNSKLAEFLTTKASKWSMADVFVIAIFMGFIGLKGLIGNQVQQLESNNPFVDLIATDHTSLNIGFTLFTLFCLSSLLLGSVTSKFINPLKEIS